MFPQFKQITNEIKQVIVEKTRYLKLKFNVLHQFSSAH